MTFPGLPQAELNQFEERRIQIQTMFTGQPDQLQTALLIVDQEESGATLKNSIAGKVGGFFEPLSSYAGFDWRTNIAMLGGFAAKEVIISTLGTVYSMGEIDTEDSGSLGDRLVNDPHWNGVVAVSALVFIMFYAPCFVTIVCIAKESSWKWAFFSMTFNTFFAFLASVAVFQIGGLFLK
jgi:ferrous iron transport protein B